MTCHNDAVQCCDALCCQLSLCCVQCAVSCVLCAVCCVLYNVEWAMGYTVIRGVGWGIRGIRFTGIQTGKTERWKDGKTEKDGKRRKNEGMNNEHPVSLLVYVYCVQSTSLPAQRRQSQWSAPGS